MPRNRKQVRVGPGTLWIGAVGATEPTGLSQAFSAVSGNPWTQGPYTNEGTTFTISPSFEDIGVAEEYDPLDVEQVSRAMNVALAIAQHGVDMLQIALNGGTVTTNNSRSQTVGITSASAALTSAGGFDTVLDVGAAISGTGIPAGATILSVASASAATLSTNATATNASLSATIVRLYGESKYEPADTAAIPTPIALGWDSRDSRERYVWRRCIQTGDVETSRRRAPDKALLPLNLRLLLPTVGKAFAYWESTLP